jgi:hypothetical protein
VWLEGLGQLKNPMTSELKMVQNIIGKCDNSTVNIYIVSRLYFDGIKYMIPKIIFN